MITFHIISLFPETMRPYLDESILGRAQKTKHIKLYYYSLRSYTKDKHGKVDDRPYAGGPGMVMTIDPLVRAWAKACATIEKAHAKKGTKPKIKTILFAPRADKFTTAKATLWAKKQTDIILICGRYEGIDSRVRTITKAEEVSVGDYVLTGGEIPALIVVDCVARQIQGVLGKFDSREEARVSSGAMYTRPEVYTYNKKLYKVPPVLLSGDHKQIDAWRVAQEVVQDTQSDKNEQNLSK
jgi:tRNA (guanine37-N1)-methyltransferase